MKCDVCDEEFENENQLMQHKAQMHAGQSSEGVMPEGDEKMQGERDDDLEEPDFPRAANQ